MICVFQNRAKKLKASGIDGFVLFNRIPEDVHNPNFFYFTNCDIPGVFYYDFKKPILFTNILEETSQTCIKNTVRIKKMSEVMDEINARALGIDKPHTALSVFDGIPNNKKRKFVDISEKLEQMRSIKSKEEIESIKKSADISKKVFENICSEDIFHMTECELHGLIDCQITSRGAEPAFRTIVASGKNIAVPHHRSTTEKIGKTLLIDFGARFNGYCTDVTRTFNSKYEGMLKKIIADVENKLKPGARAADLDVFVRKKLGNQSKLFITSLGHGIGISVHELPRISMNSKDVLEKDMILTLEPGIYVKDGIRIENDYLITEDGCKKLTNF